MNEECPKETKTLTPIQVWTIFVLGILFFGSLGAIFGASFHMCQFEEYLLPNSNYGRIIDVEVFDITKSNVGRTFFVHMFGRNTTLNFTENGMFKHQFC